jgi:CBS domain-containing protein
MDTKRVGDVMSSSNIRTVNLDDTLGYAAEVMVWAGVRHLPVVRGTEVVGLLSERDLLRRNGEVGARTAALELVERAMTRPAITIDPHEPVVAALTLVLSRRIGCLPVVGRAGLVGIVTTTDLLRYELNHTIDDRPQTGLPCTIRTVMKQAPVTVTPDATIAEAAALMAGRGIRILPVVDAGQLVVGLLADEDLRRGIGDPGRFRECRDGNEPPSATRVHDLMSRGVTTLQVDQTITAATDQLLRQQPGAVPVVDGAGKLVGMVSYLDALSGARTPAS